MAGYSPTGFERKRLAEILSDKNEAQKEVFGPDINLNPESPDGQISGLMALSDDQLWQIAEYAVNATDPDNAAGPTLSNLVKINYIERLGAVPTKMVMSNTGTPGVTIPAGQLIGELDGNLQAITKAAFTFNTSGTAEVLAELTTTGPYEVAANTFQNLATPQAGWISTTNTAAGVTGRNLETDAELRLRRTRSTGTNSQNMLDSLNGRLSNLSGVTHANVIQNQEDYTDANGLSPHSFEAIVAGGETNSIAQAIWETYPFGIGWQGATSGTAIDKQNRLQTVPFTRLTAVPIYVVATIRKRADYPVNGDTTIKENVVAYANGLLVAGRGFFGGEPVIFTELYTPINTVAGLDIVELRVGRTNPPPAGSANTAISLREYSYFTVEHITVTEAP
jgi:uncharacterized phage protein gp47/JayE